MLPPPYPEFSRFFRRLRILPIVAVAALVGGAIGGASVFVIDDATAPPRLDVAAAAANKPAKKILPMRTFDVSGPYLAAGTSAPPTPPIPASPQISVTPPLTAQQTVWPDSLSRAHKAALPKPISAPTSAASTLPAAPPSPAPPSTQAMRDQPVVPSVATRPVAHAGKVASRYRRPLYDDYGDGRRYIAPGSESPARARYETGKPRIAARRPAPQVIDRYEDRSGARPAFLPPQPPPPMPLIGGLLYDGGR